MKEEMFTKFQSQEQQEPQRNSSSINFIEITNQYSQIEDKQRYLDPPRELPKRSYSLEPDMACGWKPKRNNKSNLGNVFSINYDQYAVDEIVKELYKSKGKYKQILAYLGPRKGNSYIIHEGNSYGNPYPIEKKLEHLFSTRNGLPPNTKLSNSSLKFQSDFEGGNLDAVIQHSAQQFDLFMRVDTNSRGHTNWFYFQISNKDYVGSVTLNICNFRRDKSLYQRGLKPYIYSKLADCDWHQGGKNVRYQKNKQKYSFLDQQQDDQIYGILNTFFTMSFTYQFTNPNDTVQFAYSIPYTYSKLLKFINNLPNSKLLPSLKSLSGLSIPVVQITQPEVSDYNKRVILITGRIHPGQSNSSYVAEGIVQFLSSNEHLAKQLRKMYIFYIIPMLNPDGVIAGNYRTSFFGKDLNRTYDQSRKYAFPQTFYLLEFVKQLKKNHKKRFNIYIDLHGHSVKKNVFMYGPDFNIQHAYYESSRELPRILGNITSYFRYYSCIFRISNEKIATARAIFNRSLDIPFTYTMQSSNGFYYDSVLHNEVAFTAKKWKQMGLFVCRGLAQLKLDRKIKSQNFVRQQQQSELQNNTDDEISEGKSDSEPQQEDLSDKQLNQIQLKIQGKQVSLSPEKSPSPSKGLLQKVSSKQMPKNNQKRQKPAIFLPPINTLNRALIFSNRHKKKESFKQQRLHNIQSQLEDMIVEKQMKPRLTLNQLITDMKIKETSKSSSFHLKKEVQIDPRYRISK